ncbi:iron complex outermembrane recepter protein [Hydrocarboniphaga daqingensis]|uniref:Iron complex outermembrane recepter protein n=2 Tax=Hydrocarboniphaga daqingensis TaxID=490188 RepID=A0A1M5K763_9GAMM|nr:iron complex outermembrane recepter protein [Hydrocarboniphaga daqingensis]
MNVRKQKAAARVRSSGDASTWGKLKAMSCVPLVVGAELALMSSGAIAADAELQVAAADTQVASLEEIIVTGTRRSGGLQASESPAPIQVIGAEALSETSRPDLISSIAQIVPSFTAQAFGGDMANQTLSAKLRGLSPNHALVLINGKRRHTTANLAVLGGPFQGGAAADLNFIPAASIARIEVLTDGAAAQYGTDAIAGVINIILKSGYEGGSVDSNYGKYFDGGGDSISHSGNIGFGSGPEAFANLTVEVRNKQRSNRGGADPRVAAVNSTTPYPNSNVTLVRGYPFLNKIVGDPEIKTVVSMLNAGYKLGSVDLYGTASVGTKKANSFQNYRMPNRASFTKVTTDSDGDTTTEKVYPYPFGFSPREAIDETDMGFTGGARGTAGEWNWDLATTWGRDEVDIATIDSINTDLYADTGASPTSFDSGAYIASQLTTNFDVSREYNVGMAGPMNLALGAEKRYETYELEQGDPASTYKSGASSFPGVQPGDAGRHSRHNVGVYADVALTPIDKMLVDAAIRFEDYSDFGNTTIGKLTSRYDFTPNFALRGTVSTGFRAPTLAESYYTATNVGPSSAFVQLAPNAPAASLLGLGDGLKPEKSTNLSLGVVMHPTDMLTVTVDAYQIEVRDRVVGSGSLFSQFVGDTKEDGTAISAAIAANGNVLDPTVTTRGINLFANGLTTRTRGVDVVMTLPQTYDFGRVDYSLSGNVNKTKVTKVNASPAELGSQPLYDKTAIADLETASPQYRVNFVASWSRDIYSVTLRETLFGKSSAQELGNDGTYYETKVDPAFITDLEVSVKPTPSITLSLGANNLFNVYPDKKRADLLKTYTDTLDTSAVTLYPTYSPFGFNGGYYYGKVSYSF